VIYEGGNIIDQDLGQCELSVVGNEFNPLAEIENGIENPYADSTRGRIDVVVAGAGPNGGSNVEVDQSKLLVNLIGEDSILGMSIFIIEKP